MDIALLPDEVLSMVLEKLELCEVRLLACVCRSWLLADRCALWYSLAAVKNVQMPHARAHHALRSKANPRATFFNSFFHQTQRRLYLADKAVFDLWLKMHKADCVSNLRKTISDIQLDVNHRLRFYFGSALIHLAARKGRVRCVRALVEVHGADVELLDDGGFTPLMMAAWAGHKSVVLYLLAIGASTHQSGSPPLTSSCGGTGPYTAEVWATRKGFLSIANAIRMAPQYHNDSSTSQR